MPPRGTALSQAQLENFLSGYDSTILSYDDLPQYGRLLDIFANQKYPFRVIFLGSDTHAIGHWVLIMNRTDKTFEYYDPLGYPPDVLNKYMNRDTTLQNRTYFADMTADTEKLTFVNQPLQDKKSNNCGRFVIDRILKMKMKSKEYYALMKHIQSYMNLDTYLIKSLAIPE